MKEKKIQLRKLMELNSPKADKYLTKIAIDICAKIKKSKDNDDIFEQLDLLGEFVYKVPQETFTLVRFLIKKESTDPKIHKTPFGELKGKSHKDLILKSIELLSHIRYIAPDEVLNFVAQLSQWEDEEIKKKAIEVVQSFAKYDYNVLTKSNIGYGPQRKILDFILTWTSEQQIQYFEFIEVVAKSLLSSSIEGSEWSSVDSLKLHFGTIIPSDFLKTIRRETIELIYNLYQRTTNAGVKLKLIKVLEEASQIPPNVKYTINLEQMIIDDIKYLTDIYRKVIFDDSGNIIADSGIVEEIESRLYWLNRSEKFGIEESKKLRSDILSDSFYNVFRLLVGDPIILHEEKGRDTADEKLKIEIDILLDDITEDKLDKWIIDLNKIADQQKIIDDWQFQSFKGFLREIANTKPELADKILSDAFEYNKSLKNYTRFFLDGFRNVNKLKLWDKYVKKIVDTNSIRLTSAIVFSLNLSEGPDLVKKIRKRDIDLLEEIVEQKGKFSYLQGEIDYEIHYALINTLVRNYARNPQRMEHLIVQEIKQNPQYLKLYFQQLPFVIWKKRFDIQTLSSDTIEFLKQKLIELPDIDWHIQEILIAIGRRDGVQGVMEIFLNRIKKDTESKEKHGLKIDERYEVIPYHLNPALCNYITQHPEYKEIAGKWLENMTAESSVYNFHISHFMQEIGIGFNEILKTLIDRDDENSLMKAARAMHSMEGVNFDMCIEIVRRTDNEHILNKVSSNMYSTGIVIGEYGIANAYEGKAKELEKYKDDENKHVRKFVKRMIKSFRDSAKRERKRADEEKQLRMIEFEG